MVFTERMRVQGQNSRAKSMKAEATLTLAEWEQTIADFHGLCAYCAVRPFTLLEHFIPFGQAGEGTYVNNCLPACQQCNKLKRDHGLEVVIQRFGKELIERLQTYLVGRTRQEDMPRLKTIKQSSETKPRQEKPALVPIPSDISYLTLEQAASGLGMSKGTLHNYTKDLSIQIHKFGRHKHKYMAREDFEFILMVKREPGWKLPTLLKARKEELRSM